MMGMEQQLVVADPSFAARAVFFRSVRQLGICAPCVFCSDAAAALRWVRRSSGCFLFTSLYLGEVDGLDLIERAGELRQCQGVVLVTTDEQVTSASLGMPILRKPYALRDLQHSLEVLTQGYASGIRCPAPTQDGLLRRIG